MMIQVAEWSGPVASTVAIEANLYGFIHDTKDNPLPAVSISLNEHTTATMLDGTFSFLGTDPGDYTITCAKEGYQDFSMPVTLAEGDNKFDITMLAEGEAPPEGFPWGWVALGGGIAAAAGIGVAISRRKGGK